MTSLAVRSLRASALLRQPHQKESISSFNSYILRLSPTYSTSLTQKCHATTSITSPSQSPPRSRVNGPSSTLPPPLNIPERQPGQAFFPKYAFALGKSYVNFYKTGSKAIYANFKASRPIQAELDTKYGGSLTRAIEDGFLDRHNFQLLTRSWFDVKRVPMFALVFAICGEFTPLVVIALTSVVPYVCRIPRQIVGDRKKLEARRATSFRNLTTPLPTAEDGIKDLQRMQLLHISWSLGLSSSAWDWLGGQLPGLPTMILRRKVARTIHHLEMDDKLIKRNGGVKDMDPEEIKIALVERGVDIIGKSEQELQAYLSAWLKSREHASVEKLLLTRPAVWPSHAT